MPRSHARSEGPLRIWAWLSRLPPCVKMPCPFLGVTIPEFALLAAEERVCACGRHDIDCDHVHSCKRQTGSNKAARAILLDGYRGHMLSGGHIDTQHNTPSITKSNDKTGMGDSVLKNVELGGH
jgi:hypothetical protein